MQYELTELKKFKNDEGQVTKVLLTLRVVRENGTGTLHGHVLTTEELAEYNADETTLKDVIVAHAARLKRVIDQEPAPPTEVEHLKGEKLPEIVVKEKDVNANLTKMQQAEEAARDARAEQAEAVNS